MWVIKSASPPLEAALADIAVKKSSSQLSHAESRQLYWLASNADSRPNTRLASRGFLRQCRSSIQGLVSPNLRRQDCPYPAAQSIDTGGSLELARDELVKPASIELIGLDDPRIRRACGRFMIRR